jgi:hypothetical protein
MQALEQQRDRTLQVLASHYAAGHVHTSTLEYRVEQTMRARTVAGLRDVVWDLPPLGRSLLRALTGPRERELPARIAIRAATGTIELDVAAGPWTCVVGRSRACDVVLADPAVSRRHAVISVRGDRCSIRNLASMNGTLVNGRPVSTAVLQAGDAVSFGGAVEAFVR